MELQKQSDQITVGLWLFAIYGGLAGAFIWEPSSNMRASVLFCVALAFIPLLVWQLYQSWTLISQNMRQLQMIAAAIAGVLVVLIILDAILGFSTGVKLALIFIGFMVYAGVMAWETVQHSLAKTLPAWLLGGLVTGVLTGWMGDLSQDEMVKQAALIIVFSLIMCLAAMTGQLEAGVNSILSTEPPAEGESAIH